ncbi:MAG TPA: c-type cytochrome biogenesis protein CcmI [Pseudomonadales bacterium]
MFWPAAAALLILALAFVVWPLLGGRGARARRAGRVAEMRALYRDRLAELEAEAEAGQLDAETRQQVVDELGATLLAELPDDERTVAEAGAGGAVRTVVWALALLLPVTALIVYQSVGEPAALELAGAARVLDLDPEADRSELEQWRARLARRVERVPEDGESWYLLGVTRLQLTDFAGAAAAFAEAHRHLGPDPNVALYWLQSRYLAAGGTLDEQSMRLAQSVLEARPNHPLVLEMFAIEAYRRGDYRQAVEHLNRALANPLPPAQRAVLEGGLAQARERLGTLVPTIDVNITAPANAPSRGVLFVIARPPGGGMPYAVVRRPAATLPTSVRLDDTVTMAGLELSAAESIEVVVRLSRDGTPTATPGDWEWRSQTLNPSTLDTPVTLTATLAPIESTGT